MNLGLRNNFCLATTYSNFEQNGRISLINFIKVMRSFGRLNELEVLLNETVKEKINKFNTKEKQRVKNGPEEENNG